MSKTLLLSLLSLLLLTATACTSHLPPGGYVYCHTTEPCTNSAESSEQVQSDNTANTAAAPVLPSAYGVSMVLKPLDDYASQLALQMLDTLHKMPVDARIAVASFVDLNSDMQRSNAIGNQLSESLLHQLQQFGLAVVDVKTANDIVLRHDGDFVFSRSKKRLQTMQAIDYVVSGTLVYKPNGVMVHARMVNFDTKVVAASAQQLIPYFVISSQYSAL